MEARAPSGGGRGGPRGWEWVLAPTPQDGWEAGSHVQEARGVGESTRAGPPVFRVRHVLLSESERGGMTYLWRPRKSDHRRGPRGTCFSCCLFSSLCIPTLANSLKGDTLVARQLVSAVHQERRSCDWHSQVSRSLHPSLSLCPSPSGLLLLRDRPLGRSGRSTRRTCCPGRLLTCQRGKQIPQTQAWAFSPPWASLRATRLAVPVRSLVPLSRPFCLDGQSPRALRPAWKLRPGRRCLEAGCEKAGGCTQQPGLHTCPASPVFISKMSPGSLSRKNKASFCLRCWFLSWQSGFLTSSKANFQPLLLILFFKYFYLF